MLIYFDVDKKDYEGEDKELLKHIKSIKVNGRVYMNIALKDRTDTTTVKLKNRIIDFVAI